MGQSGKYMKVCSWEIHRTIAEGFLPPCLIASEGALYAFIFYQMMISHV